MEAADVAADAGRVTVLGAGRVLLMAGGIQGFRNEGALQGNVFSAARTEGFVESPTDGAMINDTLVAGGHAHAVEGGAGKIAGPDADVADDDVGGAEHAEIVFAETDAVSGSGLASNGEVAVGFADGEFGFEGNESGDLEDDGAGAGLLDGIAQTAGAGVVQISDRDDATAPAALSETSVAFSSGKR